MQVRIEAVRRIMAVEQFEEVSEGVFRYQQAGSSPWFLFCVSDPDGFIDVARLVLNISLTTPYIDVQQRLIRALNQLADAG